MRSAPARDAASITPPSAPPSKAVVRLETQVREFQQQLAETREHLRNSNEDHEASSEELRAANEEVRIELAPGTRRGTEPGQVPLAPIRDLPTVSTVDFDDERRELVISVKRQQGDAETVIAINTRGAFLREIILT